MPAAVDYSGYKPFLNKDGFVVIDAIFKPAEITAIVEALNTADTSRSTFRKTDDLFAIRQALKEIPALLPLAINHTLQQVIQQLFGNDYFVVKSIYFDKPARSNWFVAWHQDLTISVDRKEPVEGFGPWTVKQNQFAVQPPVSLLENNFTIRIHLDDTDEHNGALQVIPGSHAKGIYRPEMIDWTVEQQYSCKVATGGIMIMRPLLLHASGRTTNDKPRRVLHIEFSNQPLPAPLQWSERLS